MAPQLRLLRLTEVLSRRGRSRSAHYGDIARGVFPPPVHLPGARCSAWPEHEINELLSAQIAGASERELHELVTRLVEARQQAQRGWSR